MNAILHLLLLVCVFSQEDNSESESIELNFFQQCNPFGEGKKTCTEYFQLFKTWECNMEFGKRGVCSGHMPGTQDSPQIRDLCPAECEAEEQEMDVDLFSDDAYDKYVKHFHPEFYANTVRQNVDRLLSQESNDFNTTEDDEDGFASFDSFSQDKQLHEEDNEDGSASFDSFSEDDLHEERRELFSHEKPKFRVKLDTWCWDEKKNYGGGQGSGVCVEECRKDSTCLGVHMHSNRRWQCYKVTANCFGAHYSPSLTPYYYTPVATSADTRWSLFLKDFGQGDPRYDGKDWCDCGKRGKLHVKANDITHTFSTSDKIQWMYFGKAVRKVKWRCEGGMDWQDKELGSYHLTAEVWGVKYRHRNKWCCGFFCKKGTGRLEWTIYWHKV